MVFFEFCDVFFLTFEVFFDFYGIFRILKCFSLTFGVFFDFCDNFLLLWHFKISVVFCFVVFFDFWGLLWRSFRLGGILSLIHI